MVVNFTINDKLLTSAFNVSGLKIKRATIDLALEEFIQRRKRKETMELIGKIDFCKDWNPKKARGKQ